MNLAERLVDFANAGNQQKIILATGQTTQGWIMEITDEALLISTGFSEKVGKDIWINLTDLAQAELWYWDNRQDCWLTFTL